MIIRNDKYQTPNFIFHLTEYSNDSDVNYDMILYSERVSPPATKNELLQLAKFITNFLETKNE